MKIYSETPSQSKICQGPLRKKARERGKTKISDLDIHLNLEGLLRKLIVAQLWIQVIIEGLSNSKGRSTKLKGFSLVIRHLYPQIR